MVLIVIIGNITTYYWCGRLPVSRFPGNISPCSGVYLTARL
jgi:hypothetical protein